MGDGQSFALRLQANRFYSTQSFSFSDPWLGGKQPSQFSFSISQTKQFRYDYYTGQANKNQYFKIKTLILLFYYSLKFLINNILSNCALL